MSTNANTHKTAYDVGQPSGSQGEKLGASYVKEATRFDSRAHKVQRHNIRNGRKSIRTMRVGIGSFPSNLMRSVGFVTSKTRSQKLAKVGLGGGNTFTSGFASISTRPMINHSVGGMSSFMRPYLLRTRPMYSSDMLVHEKDDGGDDDKVSARGISTSAQAGGGRRKRKMYGKREEKLKQKKEMKSAKEGIEDALKDAVKDSKKGRSQVSKKKVIKHYHSGRGYKKKMGGGPSSSLNFHSDEENVSDDDDEDEKRGKKKRIMKKEVKTGAVAGVHGATSGALTVKRRAVLPEVNVTGFTEPIAPKRRKSSYKLI